MFHTFLSVFLDSLDFLSKSKSKESKRGMALVKCIIYISYNSQEYRFFHESIFILIRLGDIFVIKENFIIISLFISKIMQLRCSAIFYNPIGSM